MRSGAAFAWVCLGLSLPALAPARSLLREDLIEDPTPAQFSVCYAHTCNEMAVVGLSGSDWDGVRRLFEPPPEDPGSERERIAAAIARMEVVVGALAGTSGDRGGNFKGLGQPGQMDCIDESTNTTTYLELLEQAGLLRWHRVQTPATRGWFIFGWPHSTAVLRERGSGQRYAVDSWFRDNGEPPFILPLEQWRAGWKPEH